MPDHDIAVSVRGLSKSYTIAHHAPKHTRITEALLDTLKSFRRPAETETFWALKDVEFDIHKGDVVGIIGRNGAGKSTLLKILSRITEPTTGQIDIYGRVGSLLEVGTGFHPELTGRENIFMNGAILGMSRREIVKHFDEIVAFAEVEQFLDTPVKRYSSGMYVRLAFAVAAHLNPEILIVDEVLAVGDIEFQKKCLGKMQDVAAKDGRTVLFVSHNLEAVRKLCNKGIFMRNGRIALASSSKNVLDLYLQSAENTQAYYAIERPNIDDAPGYAHSLTVEDAEGNPAMEIPVGQFWKVRVRFTITQRLQHFIMGLCLLTKYDHPLRTTWSMPQAIGPGEYEAVFEEDTIFLEPGKYSLMLGLSEQEKDFHRVEKAGTLHIADMSAFEQETSHVKLTNCGTVLNQLNVSIHQCHPEPILVRQ